MKKKTRSKVNYTDDKGEMDGKWRIVRRGEAARSRRIARQAAGENQGHARARQFSLGILQAGSPETKYQLSAHDPEPGAFLRSVSHLTNNKNQV